MLEHVLRQSCNAKRKAQGDILLFALVEKENVPYHPTGEKENVPYQATP